MAKKKLPAALQANMDRMKLHQPLLKGPQKKRPAK
jgi:hypothetical protein